MATEKMTVLDKKAAADEMMKKYMQLGTPVAEHRLLAKMAGKWTAKIKSWMEPGAQAMEGTGTSEGKMILEGRFLAHTETWDQEMMGRHYMGMGVMGFDNHTKKYVSTWFDNMGTSILFFEEVPTMDKDSMVMEARHMDAIQGLVTYRTVETTIDSDNYRLELYVVDKNNMEFKMMDTLYTRMQ